MEFGAREEGVVVVDREGEGLGFLVQEAQNGVGGLEEVGVVLLHALLSGLPDGHLVQHHVALAPAGGHGVHDHHVLVDLLHHIMARGRHSGESRNGDKLQHDAKGDLCSSLHQAME